MNTTNKISKEEFAKSNKTCKTLFIIIDILYFFAILAMIFITACAAAELALVQGELVKGILMLLCTGILLYKLIKWIFEPQERISARHNLERKEE